MLHRNIFTEDKKLQKLRSMTYWYKMLKNVSGRTQERHFSLVLDYTISPLSMMMSLQQCDLMNPEDQITGVSDKIMIH